MKKRLATILIVLGAQIIVGCAPQAAPGALRASADSQKVSGPKRIVAAITGDPHTFATKLNPGSYVPGISALENLLAGKMTLTDEAGHLHPQLAETVPSAENGLWKVLPDGRMETTWRLKEGTVWQDGLPLTADDLAFTAAVARDRESAEFYDRKFEPVESVTALDARTILVSWKKPSIEADSLFAIPVLPQHVLEGSFTENKAGFSQLRYWLEEFMGAGPFKLQDLVRGSHLVLVANDRFILGRPRIDEVEIRFITDPDTLVANILAGTVQTTFHRTLTLEQAQAITEQGWDGRMVPQMENVNSLHPQFVVPDPPLVTDARFRRALIHAIDRQQLVDTFFFGAVSVAHTYLDPKTEGYKDLESSVVRYDYDPRKAEQILREELGFTRDSDGTLRDAAHQRLQPVEIRSTPTRAVNQKSASATVEWWKQVGVPAEHVVIPSQRLSDAEYLALFPAFDMGQRPNKLPNLQDYHSSNTRLAQNRYSGSNVPGYRNPDLDRLIERFAVAIPMGERLQLAGQIVHLETDQVVPLTLYYGADPLMVSNQLLLPHPAKDPWDPQDWDLRS